MMKRKKEKTGRMPIYITKNQNQNGFFPIKKSEGMKIENFFNFKVNGEPVNHRGRRSHNSNYRRVNYKKYNLKGKSLNKNEKKQEKKFVKKFSTMIDQRYHQSTKEGSALKINGIQNKRQLMKKIKKDSGSYDDDYEAEASDLMNEAFKDGKSKRNLKKKGITVERQPAATAIFEDVDSLVNKSSDFKKKVDRLSGNYQTFRIKKRKEMTIKATKTKRFKIDEYGRFIKARMKPGNFGDLSSGQRPFSLDPSSRKLNKKNKEDITLSSRKGRFGSNTEEVLFRKSIRRKLGDPSERELRKSYKSRSKERNIMANNFMRQSSRRDTVTSQKRGNSHDKARAFSKKKRNYDKPWLMNINNSRKPFAMTQKGWRASSGNKYARRKKDHEQDFINFENYRQSIKDIIKKEDKHALDRAYATVGSEGFNRLKSKKTESKEEVKGIVKSLIEEKRSRRGDKKKRLNNYEIGPKLGKGSYAMVHLGIDVRNQAKYAIKTYDKKRLYNKTRRTIVEREIQVLAFCNHEKIVKLKKTIHTKNHIHLVMELAGGMVLSKFHKSRPDKRLPEKEAAIIFKQILVGLEYCHDNLIFHRDLKTENVMVDKQMNVKLIDFGFSLRQRSLGKLSLFCGTPNYMSPEVILKKEYYGAPNDVWALGVLLFRITSGRFPFVGKDDKALHRRIINLDYNPSSRFSRELTNLIRTILVYNPKKRPSCSKILEHSWLKIAE